MTNELEKQFFQCFGIEPKTNQVYGMQLDYHIEEYPQITDRILLELICIDFEENPYKCRGGVDITNIKEYILNEFIREYENDLYRDKQDIKHQVRTLFKES